MYKLAWLDHVTWHDSLDLRVFLTLLSSLAKCHKLAQLFVLHACPVLDDGFAPRVRWHMKQQWFPLSHSLVCFFSLLAVWRQVVYVEDWWPVTWHSGLKPYRHVLTASVACWLVYLASPVVRHKSQRSDRKMRGSNPVSVMFFFLPEWRLSMCGDPQPHKMSATGDSMVSASPLITPTPGQVLREESDKAGGGRKQTQFIQMTDHCYHR